MSSKALIWIGITVGSLIGGWLGSILDHGNILGGWSLGLSTLGAVLGLWIGFKIGQNSL